MSDNYLNPFVAQVSFLWVMYYLNNTTSPRNFEYQLIDYIRIVIDCIIMGYFNITKTVQWFVLGLHSVRITFNYVNKKENFTLVKGVYILWLSDMCLSMSYFLCLIVVIHVMCHFNYMYSSTKTEGFPVIIKKGLKK